MNLRDNLTNTLRTLRRNKVRSFLTMLGIIIGVMAVVVIMSVGAGAQSLILNQIKSLGSNLVGILPGKSEENGPPVGVFGVVITTLKYDDIKALLNVGDPHITAATVYARGSDTITTRGVETDTNFVGTSYMYPQVENIIIDRGRFFDEDDEKSFGRVAVLGSQVAEELFNDEDPVGKIIKIKRTNFTVIGTIKKRGTSAFQNQDDQVFVPITTAQKLLLGIDYVSFARVKIDDERHVQNSIESIEKTLRSRHNISNPENDDFSARSANQGLDALTSVTNALKFFLTAIASISLIVGGIGIMNIMLAVVEERTKEIGLRKAVGAKNKHIIIQFLVETVIITFIGRIVGIVLGVLLSFTVALVAKGRGYNWDLIITPFSIILAALVSISVGLIFGISPARRASKLSPIEALRYE